MTPATAKLIDVARHLAWMPLANMGHASLRYRERRDAHHLVVSLLPTARRRRTGDPVLDALLAAIRRVAGCTFSNRYGRPYADRRQAMLELRGCLVVWDQDRAA